jgi:hypothetical protein
MSVALCTLVVARAQVPDRASSGANRSPVRLLPGYKIQLLSAIDSLGGTIWKDRGLRITFDIGGHFGVEADSIDKNDIVWREEQVVSGQQLICVYTKAHHLVVSFPQLNSNFESKVRSERDVAEMLLMVSTYDQKFPYPTGPENTE